MTTPPLTPADAARRYIEIVGSKDLAPLDDLFADSLVAKTGDTTFDKAKWIQGVGRLLAALQHNEIRHVSGDDSTAVVYYDFVTDTTAGAVPCAELISVADGRIATIELIFERLHWPEFIQAVQERAAAAQR